MIKGSPPSLGTGNSSDQQKAAINLIANHIQDSSFKIREDQHPQSIQLAFSPSSNQKAEGRKNQTIITNNNQPVQKQRHNIKGQIPLLQFQTLQQRQLQLHQQQMAPDNAEQQKDQGSFKQDPHSKTLQQHVWQSQSLQNGQFSSRKALTCSSSREETLSTQHSQQQQQHQQLHSFREQMIPEEYDDQSLHLKCQELMPKNEAGSGAGKVCTSGIAVVKKSNRAVKTSQQPLNMSKRKTMGSIPLDSAQRVYTDSPLISKENILKNKILHDYSKHCVHLKMMSMEHGQTNMFIRDSIQTVKERLTLMDKESLLSQDPEIEDSLNHFSANSKNQLRLQLLTQMKRGAEQNKGGGVNQNKKKADQKQNNNIVEQSSGKRAHPQLNIEDQYFSQGKTTNNNQPWLQVHQPAPLSSKSLEDHDKGWTQTDFHQSATHQESLRRKEALALQQWLKHSLQQALGGGNGDDNENLCNDMREENPYTGHGQDGAGPTLSKCFEQLQVVYNAAYKEIIRQVSGDCKELGSLLETVWKGNNELLKKMFLLQKKDFDVMEQQDAKNISILQKHFLKKFQQLEAERNAAVNEANFVGQKVSQFQHENQYLIKKMKKLENDITEKNLRIIELDRNHDIQQQELMYYQEIFCQINQAVQRELQMIQQAVNDNVKLDEECPPLFYNEEQGTVIYNGLGFLSQAAELCKNVDSSYPTSQQQAMLRRSQSAANEQVSGFTKVSKNSNKEAASRVNLLGPELLQLQILLHEQQKAVAAQKNELKQLAEVKRQQQEELAKTPQNNQQEGFQRNEEIENIIFLKQQEMSDLICNPAIVNRSQECSVCFFQDRHDVQVDTDGLIVVKQVAERGVNCCLESMFLYQTLPQIKVHQVDDGENAQSEFTKLEMLEAWKNPLAKEGGTQSWELSQLESTAMGQYNQGTAQHHMMIDQNYPPLVGLSSRLHEINDKIKVVLRDPKFHESIEKRIVLAELFMNSIKLSAKLSMKAEVINEQLIDAKLENQDKNLVLQNLRLSLIKNKFKVRTYRQDCLEIERKEGSKKFDLTKSLLGRAAMLLVSDITLTENDLSLKDSDDQQHRKSSLADQLEQQQHREKLSSFVSGGNDGNGNVGGGGGSGSKQQEQFGINRLSDIIKNVGISNNAGGEPASNNHVIHSNDQMNDQDNTIETPLQVQQQSKTSSIGKSPLIKPDDTEDREQIEDEGQYTQQQIQQIRANIGKSKKAAGGGFKSSSKGKPPLQLQQNSGNKQQQQQQQQYQQQQAGFTSSNEVQEQQLAEESSSSTRTKPFIANLVQSNQDHPPKSTVSTSTKSQNSPHNASQNKVPRTPKSSFNLKEKQFGNNNSQRPDSAQQQQQQPQQQQQSEDQLIKVQQQHASRPQSSHQTQQQIQQVTEERMKEQLRLKFESAKYVLKAAKNTPIPETHNKPHSKSILTSILKIIYNIYLEFYKQVSKKAIGGGGVGSGIEQQQQIQQQQQQQHLSPLSLLLYDLYHQKFGFKKIAEKKLFDFYMHIKRFEVEPRIGTFSRFIGLQDSKTNQEEKSLNVYETAVYIKSLFLLDPQLDKAFCNNEQHAVRTDAVVQTTQQLLRKVMEEEELEKMINSFMNGSLTNMYDVETVADRLLYRYTAVKNEQQQIYQGIFESVMDAEHSVGMEEFAVLLQTILPELYRNTQQLRSLRALFLRYCDQQFSDSFSANRISLSRFSDLCHENRIFRQTQQNYYFNQQNRYNAAMAVPADFNGKRWALQKKIIRIRFAYTNTYDDLCHRMIEKIDKAALLRDGTSQHKQGYITYKLLHDYSMIMLIEKELNDIIPVRLTVIQQSCSIGLGDIQLKQ